MDTLKQMLDDVRGKRVKNYTLLTFPLDVARANEPIIIAGSYIYVLVLDGTAKIKLNEIIGDDIDLYKYRQITSPFYRLFLTHIAQATKVLTLAIGVSSEVFSISDFQSPDIGAMASDISDLKKTDAYNYGTQVTKSNTIDLSVTTVIIHTVTAGKILILDSFFHFGIASSGGGIAKLFARDTGDTTVYELTKFNLQNIGQNGSASLNPKMSIPEGYDICISSNAAGIVTAAFIKGREF